MAAARRGDRTAFGDLVRATHADVYALAYRLTDDPDDAREVAVAAYLHAHRALPGFDGATSFPAWMYGITADCASTHRTGRRRGARGAGTPVGIDRIDRLASAVAGLPARLRSVVVLRDVYEVPPGDIAAGLGISVAAAKLRLRRGRRRLRAQLYPPRRHTLRGAGRHTAQDGSARAL